LHVDHAHVRDVEHARVATHGVVLVDLRAVVQRHVPAAEIDHARTGGAVDRVQGGGFRHVDLRRGTAMRGRHGATPFRPVCPFT
jgi:hypothetical protein